ncbi:hypothetical protein Tsp_06085 [Trichinella spiralis]|uniref:hypothetical protein n=1 Tax=Trichinella spiralis TaxID=6334 RepID=UPI0001EFB43F|nr:hypothetical protein Tsp_06085 [Trichinella spiralis]
MIQITLRHLSSAGARIDHSSMRFQCDMTKISNSCGLCGLMKPVLRPTSAHLAFSSRPMRNCEDESRILNDLHRITRVLNYANFRKKYLRECPGHSLKAKENLHIHLKANIVQ